MFRFLSVCLLMCLLAVVSMGFTCDEPQLDCAYNDPKDKTSRRILPQLDEKTVDEMYKLAATLLQRSNYLELQDNLEKAIKTRHEAYLYCARIFEAKKPMVSYYLGLFYLHGLVSLDGKTLVGQNYDFAYGNFCQAIKLGVSEACILAAYCCKQFDNPMMQDFLKPFVSPNNQTITLIFDPFHFKDRISEQENYLIVQSLSSGKRELGMIQKRNQILINQAIGYNNKYRLARQHYHEFETLKESQRKGRNTIVTTYNLASFYRYGLTGFDDKFVLLKDAKLYRECLESLYALGVPEAAVQLAEYYLSDEFKNDNKSLPSQCQDSAYIYLEYAHRKKCRQFKVVHEILNKNIYYKLGKQENGFNFTVTVGKEYKEQFYIRAPVIVKPEQSIEDTLRFITDGETDDTKKSGTHQNLNKKQSKNKGKSKKQHYKITVTKTQNAQLKIKAPTETRSTNSEKTLVNHEVDKDDTLKPFTKVLSKTQRKKQKQAERQAGQNAIKLQKEQEALERKQQDVELKKTQAVSQQQDNAESNKLTIIFDNEKPVERNLNKTDSISEIVAINIQQTPNQYNQSNSENVEQNYTQEEINEIKMIFNKKNFDEQGKKNFVTTESVEFVTAGIKQSTRLTNDPLQLFQQFPETNGANEPVSNQQQIPLFGQLPSANVNQAEVAEINTNQNDIQCHRNEYDYLYPYSIQPTVYNNGFNIPYFYYDQQAVAYYSSSFVTIPQADLYSLQQQSAEQQRSLQLSQKNFYEKNAHLHKQIIENAQLKQQLAASQIQNNLLQRRLQNMNK